MRSITLGTLAALALVACSKEPPPPAPTPSPPAVQKPEEKPAAKAPEPAPTKVEPKAEPKAEAPATPAPEGAGPAYFVVQGASGLVKLEGGKLSEVKLDGNPRDVAVGPDGVVWASTYSGVYRLAPGKAPEKLPSVTGPDKLAPGKGELWATTFQGVVHFDGSKWTVEEKAKVGEGISFFGGIAVDGEGAVWVSTSEKLYRREKDGWKDVSPADQVKAAKPYYSDLTVGPGGALYVKNIKGVLRHQGGSWSKLPLGIVSTLAAIAPDGRMLLTSYQGASISAPGGRAQRVTGVKAKSYRRAVADGAGRFWVTTDYGIAIINPDGKLAQQWEPGQLKEVAGEIRGMAIVGKGPELPQLGAKAVGTIKGKILRGGSAVASAIVELCESPSMILFGRGTTPCSKAIFKTSATTDAEGGFTMPGVPIGSYRFAVKAGPKWMIMFGGDCCAKMKEGQTYDIGAITLREK